MHHVQVQSFHKWTTEVRGLQAGRTSLIDLGVDCVTQFSLDLIQEFVTESPNLYGETFVVYNLYTWLTMLCTFRIP